MNFFTFKSELRLLNMRKAFIIALSASEVQNKGIMFPFQQIPLHAIFHFAKFVKNFSSVKSEGQQRAFQI